MKLLFDQNLSPKLGALLERYYPGSQHVRDLGMGNASDETVWSYARDNGFIIASKDSDFYHRSMLLGQPPKVVWLKIGNCATATIVELLKDRSSALQAFEEDESASFLVLP